MKCENKFPRVVVESLKGKCLPMDWVLFYKLSSSSNVVLRVFAFAKHPVCITESGREQQPLLLHSTMPKEHLPLPPGTQSTWQYLG